jgi:glycosyl transferase family 25
MKIPFYITNLKRRPDRKSTLLENIKPYTDLVDFNINQWGPDSKDITNKLLKDIDVKTYPHWKIDSDNSWWNRNIKLGEVGCAVSHLRMWEHAYNKGHSFTIFGEDDIRFSDDWLLKFKLTIDRLKTLNIEWDLLYLGRVLQEGQEDKIYDKELVNPAFSYCLHSYALSREGIKKILNVNYNHNIIPVDEFIPAMYMSHPREDIRKMFNDKSFIALAYQEGKCLITQIPKSTSGSDTEDSLEYVTP